MFAHRRESSQTGCPVQCSTCLDPHLVTEHRHCALAPQTCARTRLGEAIRTGANGGHDDMQFYQRTDEPMMQACAAGQMRAAFRQDRQTVKTTFKSAA